MGYYNYGDIMFICDYSSRYAYFFKCPFSCLANVSAHNCLLHRTSHGHYVVGKLCRQYNGAQGRKNH